MRSRPPTQAFRDVELIVGGRAPGQLGLEFVDLGAQREVLTGDSVVLPL